MQLQVDKECGEQGVESDRQIAVEDRFGQAEVSVCRHEKDAGKAEGGPSLIAFLHPPQMPAQWNQPQRSQNEEPRYPSGRHRREILAVWMAVPRRGQIHFTLGCIGCGVVRVSSKGDTE